MTNYFVRTAANGGSDAAAGTSAGAAWLTLGKALGASGIASGDTVYIGAGIYRELCTVAMTSPTAETRVVADVDGAFTGDAGPVILTAYLTNDTTAPSTASATLILAGRDYLTFEKLTIVGSGVTTGQGCIDLNTAHSRNVTLRGITFISGGKNQLVRLSNTANEATTLIVEDCVFFHVHGSTSWAGCLTINLATSATADYDSTILVRNNVFHINHSGYGVYIDATGAAAFKGGGVDVINNSFYGGDNPIRCNSGNLATTIPCTAEGNTILGAGTALYAITLGQLIEDRNRIVASTARTNVSIGTNSIDAYAHALLLEFGQAERAGRAVRAFGTPMAGSPILGFGNAAGAPTVDALNRPRPAGGPLTNAVGAYERHDSGVLQGTTSRSGSALAITGPGDHDFRLPVNAVATTVTVYMRYDTNHATTNKPQAILVADTEIGVSAQTVTMAAAVDTWEQLTIGPFTPTRKGVATIRLVSRSAAANGIAFADDFAVT